MRAHQVRVLDARRERFRFLGFEVSWRRSTTEAIRTVNQIARGWGSYFHYANSAAAFSSQQNWLCQRTRRWLWQKYRRKHGLYMFFTNERLYGQYGLYRLPLVSARNR